MSPPLREYEGMYYIKVCERKYRSTQLTNKLLFYLEKEKN